MCIQGGEDSLRHFVDRAETVDLDQQAARAVDLKQRLGLFSVDLEADSDGFLVVVGAPVDLRTLEQPCDDLVNVCQQRDDRVEWAVGLGEVVVEGSHLLQRAWVAVQQEADSTIALCEPIFHYLVGDLVTDVPTRFHDRPHLTCQRGIGVLHGSEYVAGRDRGYLIVLSDLLGLRALACTRRAHDEEPH